MSVYKSSDPAETFELGKKIAQSVGDGSVIAMFGGMGMGKTAFTRGLAQGLGIDPKNVSSPTFAIVHEYSGKRKKVHEYRCN